MASLNINCNGTFKKFSKISYRSQFHVKFNDDCLDVLRIYCKTLADSNTKLAFFIEDIQFFSFNSICMDSEIKLKRFDNKLTLFALSTLKHSFLHTRLEYVLQKTIPAGIPQFLEKHSIETMFKKYKPRVEKKSKVLTLDDLGFRFALWLSACSISCIEFLGEIFVWRFNLNIGMCLFLKAQKMRMRTVL